jgi:hypothetical protein
MAMAATRHHQLAVGGIVKKPKRQVLYTENGTPIETTRIERAPLRDEDGNVLLDAHGQPRLEGEIIWEEHWSDPDVRAMEWELDRLDPETYVKQPDVAVTNETHVSVETRAEMQSRAQVVAEAVKLLADQGIKIRLLQALNNT